MRDLREVFIKESFDVNGTSFKIPEGIVKYFNIEGSLSNIDKWRAKIILGNSMPKDKKKSDWDNIGYVWISLDSNTIVPIARSDEHHYGGDLIEYYMKKKLIPREEYYPIWAISGNNYVSEEDVPRALQALRKFRIYGGKNVTIQNWRMGGSIRATADTFIKQGGNLKIKRGEIAEEGQKVIDTLKQIEELYKKYREGMETGKRTQSIEKKTFSLIYRFIKDGLHFDGFFRNLDLEENDVKRYKDRIIKAEGEGNVEKAIEAIFAFGGLKNEIHNRLREIVKKAKSGDMSSRWNVDQLSLFFGDLDEVIHILGGI